MTQTQPELVDTGFTAHATSAVSRDHALLLAATLDVDADVVDTGELPLLWHWACFLPRAATSDLGPDGHPRRRDEMAGFPQRMWVGGRVYYDALVDPTLAVEVLAKVAPDEQVEVARPLVVEQSNSSVVYDERLIMKFFRRLHPEPNPDVEINRVLNDRGFPHVVPQRADL